MLAVAEPLEEGVVDGLPEAAQPEEARNAPERGSLIFDLWTFGL